MPSPSWPAVIIGAALVGALLGVVQPPASESDALSQQTPTPTPAATPPAAAPRHAEAETEDEPWPDTVRTRVASPESSVVALTFDDGPHPEWTPAVLDELARHGATATFCVVGDQIPGNEAIVRRIAAEGHVLCNHTQSHDYGLPVRDAGRIDAEIAEVTATLSRLAPDAQVSAFRAPGGRFADVVVAAADDQGLTSWAWSVDPRDWQADDPDAVVAALLDQVEPGSVVLLHDGGGDRAATVAALADVIPVLQSVGYEFVGLPAA